MPTLQENTGIEGVTPQDGNISQRNGDDAPAYPTRIDDKAAALEHELLERTAHFNKERFVYLFAIGVLVVAHIGSFAPTKVFVFLIISWLIISIGLANWLQFPWVIELLGKWEHLLSRRLEGKKDIDADFET